MSEAQEWVSENIRNNVENLRNEVPSVIGMLPMPFQRKTLMKINFQRVFVDRHTHSIAP